MNTIYLMQMFRNYKLNILIIKFALILFFFMSDIFGQSPAGIWYFGNKAGINFNGSSDPVAITDGELVTFEGCATISDNSGNLLFYTDGTRVWNRNHIVMPNGEGLFGDPSSTQSAVIVPKPNSPNLFYVFTVDELAKPNGLNYSIIDLNLDNGNGDIIQKNVNLTTPCLEKITVVKHFNDINYWVISHKYNSDDFIAYELTPSAINAPVVSSVGLTISGSTQRTLGYMKSSPNGQYLACAHSGNSSAMQLFNFNNQTGQLNLISTSVMDSDNIGGYGVEFSSNSKVLYISNINFTQLKSEIYQYDIESENETIINNSKIVVGSYIHNISTNSGILTGLQLGPNQKIYISRNKYGYLGTIENPNTLGNGCQLIYDSLYLNGRFSYYGLPTFITSYLDLSFTSSNFCFGSLTNFNIPSINNVTSVLWNFGDPTSSNNTSSSSQTSHTFSTSGIFNVNVTITVLNAPNPVIFSKSINILPTPIANTPTTFEKCETTDNEKAIFNLTTKNVEIIGTQNPIYFNVVYYKSLEDAQNKINPLPTNYENISNPEIIFARIQGKNAANCFDITSFEIKVIKKPIVEKDIILYYCKNKYPEKITLNAGEIYPTGIYQYLWSNGQNTASIEINESGTYSVDIENNFGCIISRKITVLNSELPSLNYTESENNGTSTINILTIGIGNYVFSLDDIDGNYQISSFFNNIKAGNHTIFVKDLNGCGTSQISFYIIGYPSYFTPNNDSFNDDWGLSDNFSGFKYIYIYDRFGKLIKVLNKVNFTWDGYYLNKKMPSSDYWFKIFLNDGKTKSGHFSLKR